MNWNKAQYEIAEFEQLCQNETADTTELTQRLEQHVQEKITFQLNELKAKTGIALQEIGQVTLHVKQLFGAEKSAKVKGLAKLKQRLYKRFGKQIIASKECLAKQLEHGTSKLKSLKCRYRLLREKLNRIILDEMKCGHF